MTISNQAPLLLQLGDLDLGFSGVLVNSNNPTDADAVGKVFWVNNATKYQFNNITSSYGLH